MRKKWVVLVLTIVSLIFLGFIIWDTRSISYAEALQELKNTEKVVVEAGGEVQKTVTNDERIQKIVDMITLAHQVDDDVWYPPVGNTWNLQFLDQNDHLLLELGVNTTTFSGLQRRHQTFLIEFTDLEELIDLLEHEK